MIKTLSLFAALQASLLLHPVHETVCEIEWNDQTDRVEVALRLDALDEQWIEKQRGVKRSGGILAKEWYEAFLRSHVMFDPKSVGEPDPGNNDDQGLRGREIRWVGRKEQRGHVWWFFEVVCDPGRPPESVQSRLLFDRHLDYQHRIVILSERLPESGKRPTILLTERKPKADLTFGP